MQQYRHDRCLEETGFHFIGQIEFIIEKMLHADMDKREKKKRKEQKSKSEKHLTACW